MSTNDLDKRMDKQRIYKYVEKEGKERKERAGWISEL